MVSILVCIYGQDLRNHCIHMIRIEVEVIKRIGQAKSEYVIEREMCPWAISKYFGD
jgi:hypothetical protein